MICKVCGSTEFVFIDAQRATRISENGAEQLYWIKQYMCMGCRQIVEVEETDVDSADAD